MASTVGWVHCGLIVSALAIAAASALAQTPQQREACYRTSAADDQTISGCTAVIQGGKESQDNLAIAYYNRGIGYQSRKDYELALKDYDQATRIAPNDPLPSAATPGAGSARPTRPSPTSTRRSGSSPTTPMPTKIAASSTTT